LEGTVLIALASAQLDDDCIPAILPFATAASAQDFAA
jgi:hypothetical protein